jgi:hypothetical protein
MQPAEDFAFRYEHFDCGAQLIDTFKGPYRRTIAGPNGGRGGDVSIPQDANVRLGNYMLEVRNAGREHTIWWRERSSAPTPSPITEEDRRRDELMRTIFRVVLRIRWCNVCLRRWEDANDSSNTRIILGGIVDRVLRRTRRSYAGPESDSVAHRTDAQHSAAGRASRPTSTPVSRDAFVCPLPSATV